MKLYFCLILPLLLFSCIVNGENRPGFVCGQFNKNIIEVPGEYVFPFAEYEGYSYFDPRFIENKKGCEANFRVLPMRMSWPDLKPFSEVSHDVKMIEVYVEPLNGDPEKYFSHKKNIYLNMGVIKRKGELYYDEELELYFNEVFIESKHINGNKVYVNIIKYGYYWDEDNGEVNVLMECSWRQLDDSYRRFKLLSLMPEFGLKYSVAFEFSNLVNWDAIQDKVRLFLSEYIKN
ncbi:hypothetical protein [Providencia huaxiensis]|uniref:hypothetical protein n=1 Tax=Providencia huaxiensis TaxID=2027290 RepID=UPI001B388D95|nr:hypothetical protein [Providencia huaxiensis]MBQ0533167.1 hypothetical protein [Providencia huaxiensis]MBQ0588369.1 hypothetical protein [Providencia huaxiensis]MDI7238696.1 hypothetical protein [Providencia huaxiensis]